MRKVFLKICLVICFALGIAGTVSLRSEAEESNKIEVVSGEEYVLVKVEIDGMTYIFVYDEAGVLQQIYPESIAPTHGGPH